METNALRMVVIDSDTNGIAMEFPVLLPDTYPKSLFYQQAVSKRDNKHLSTLTFQNWRELMAEKREHPELRFDQLFCDKFSIKNDQELFYEPDPNKAMKIIWENYVDMNSEM